jgi:hypothetical protein
MHFEASDQPSLHITCLLNTDTKYWPNDCSHYCGVTIRMRYVNVLHKLFWRQWPCTKFDRSVFQNTTNNRFGFWPVRYERTLAVTLCSRPRISDGSRGEFHHFYDYLYFFSCRKGVSKFLFIRLLIYSIQPHKLIILHNLVLGVCFTSWEIWCSCDRAS